MSDPVIDDIGSVAAINEYLDSNDATKLEAVIQRLTPTVLARSILRLGKSRQTRLIELLGPERSADVFSKIFSLQGVSLVEQLPPEYVVPLVKEMRGEEQIQIMRKMGESDAESVMQDMKAKEADRIRERMRYRDNTAGSLMITEYLAYNSDMLVNDVLEDFRRLGEQYSDYDIQYAYVVSETGRLIGVLRMRDLLLAPKTKVIADIMIKKPLHVNVNTTLGELRDFFREHAFLGSPVTDDNGKLMGVVRSSTVRETVNKRNNQLFLKFAGIVGGEEFRTMPLLKRSSRRLSWLSINIVLNIIAASVIALYQDTLEKAIVLAVFLPIISDMSGCSGNQAVAVSIREMTLGLVRPREILRVLTKESAIGLLNGFVLGVLLGCAALLWKGNPYLGLVVGASLAANTLVAVSFGGLIPLVLRGMRADPALASGPLLTTITDMCGFFFVLSFASFMLPRLTG